VTIEHVAGDQRERLLMRTERGIHILDTILTAAANRLWDGLPPLARGRRVSEATKFQRQATDKLLGPLQLTFFDKRAPTRTRKQPQKDKQPLGMPKRRNERMRTPKEKGTPKRESLMERIYG